MSLTPKKKRSPQTEIKELRKEVEELRSEIARLRNEISYLRNKPDPWRPIGPRPGDPSPWRPRRDDGPPYQRPEGPPGYPWPTVIFSQTD